MQPEHGRLNRPQRLGLMTAVAASAVPAPMGTSAVEPAATVMPAEPACVADVVMIAGRAVRTALAALSSRPLVVYRL